MNHLKAFFFLVFSLFVSIYLNAQVGINTDASDPDDSAILDVKSSDKGVLVPRMTQAQRIDITAPALGLLVYQTDTPEGFWYYSASGWLILPATPIKEIRDGDGNTKVQVEESADENKIRFDVAGTEAMVINNQAKVGIGTEIPGAKLEIAKVATSADEDALKIGVDGEHSASIKFFDDDNESTEHMNISYDAGKEQMAIESDQASLLELQGKISIAGSYITSGNAYDVYISGKYAYIADGSFGLQIIDISDPSSPSVSGTFNTSGVAYDIYVSGKFAYVADGYSGLQIIDISDPSSPSLSGSFNTPADVAYYGVYVSGKYVYIAGGYGGLQIIDISDPSSLSLSGSFDTNGLARSVYVSGKYAYIADYDEGLKIIDISDPSSPSLSGSLNTNEFALGVYVSGKYAYIADGSSGLKIIDISDPSSPSVSGSFNTSGVAYDIYVSGKFAYTADTGGGLKIIDISDPSSPSLRGSFNTNDWALGIFVSGKYAYIASNGFGLEIINIFGLETPGIQTGNIKSNNMTITENLDVRNNLYIGNGLNVGQGGILSDGPLAMTVVETKMVKAVDSEGLKLHDDGGNGLFVEDGGNIGIGTSNPGAHLHIKNTGDANFIIEADTGNNNENSNPRLLFRQDNALTTAAIGLIGGNGEIYDDSDANSLYLMSENSASLHLGTNSSIRATITEGGTFGINTTTPTATLSVLGSANKVGGGTWAVYSDKRSKENILDYKKGLTELLQLRPVQFNYKEEFGWGKDTYVGLIAQELEEVLPSMVSEIEMNNIDDFKQVDPNELMYMLINAMKEQQEINEELLERVEALERE